MWFKNLKIFRLSPDWKISAQELESCLEKLQYNPSNKQLADNIGWIPVVDHSGLVHSVSGHYLLKLRSEKKLLPTTVINQVSKEKAAQIEEQQGYKVGRKQMKELKEQVRDELLPKAFSVYRDTMVWIDCANHTLAIDAAASAKADEVIGTLAKTINPFPLEALYTEMSPASAMTNWLLSDEAPEGFSIDSDTELKANNESRAAVRYVRHLPEVADLQKQIESGKQCTRLGMTWNDKISFVFTDTLDIKRVTPLDVLTENQDFSSQNDEERFDADMTLMCEELSILIKDVVDVLGGYKAL